MKQHKMIYIIFFLIYTLTGLFFGSLTAQTEDRVNKFSAGVSIVDLNPGINSRFYFLPKQSIQATIGAVEGGAFFNVAYLYDFYSIKGKPDISFYGGGGAISTVVKVSVPLFGSKTFSATGLWFPLGISLSVNQFEAFAEIDFVVYTGAYSGTEATWTLGGRMYF
ncbi:MAG: hypothetical protein OEZ34_06870 [Spirochaetia bacterium]|nr:hypothetical protein [Spirochaetia bacterium]